MSLRLAGVGFVILVVLSFNARAVTLDFQSLAGMGDGPIDPQPYIEDGFSITATSLFAVGTGSSVYRGSPALRDGTNSNAADIVLARTGGSGFNLVSIDLAEVNTGSATVAFTGYYQGGGSIMESVTLDGNFSSDSGFETFTFTGFNNLSRVEWNNPEPFHQFDNIMVETVPVPAAVWLFVSGLLGLLGLSRRR